MSPAPIAAGAFDAHEFENPKALQPAQQPPVAGRGGDEALDTEQRPSLVERGRHVHVEVRVDPCGDAPRDSGHRHLFLSLGWVTPHRRDDGQDSDEPCLGKLL